MSTPSEAGDDHDPDVPAEPDDDYEAL